jgi:hypothetical protein
VITHQQLRIALSGLSPVSSQLLNTPHAATGLGSGEAERGKKPKFLGKRDHLFSRFSSHKKIKNK